MKKLINTPSTVVAEGLQGLVLGHPHLQLLHGLPHIKVVIDSTHDKQHVAVIAGGGSGHEPAHAGYVGAGMLAAAVCGEVFASPPAAAVLAAILAVAGPPGCLLIVKQYTGDRIAFGLAAEQAKARGIPVEVVFVGEDCAIDTPGLAGRRGLAGTVLVEKVAGAAAAAGQPLSQVVAAARAAAASMGTLGVALTVCTLPGQQPSDRLGPEEVELGLGIHGEPGHERIPWAPASALVPRMIDRIAAFTAPPPPGAPSGGGAAGGAPARGAGPLAVGPGARLVLMVNNLGATSPLEASLVTREAVRHLEGRYQAKVERVFTGHFMTSLDMAGVSLTLMAATPEALEALDAPTAAPAWPQPPAVCDAAKPLAPLPAVEDAAAAAPGVAPGDASPAGRALAGCVAAACRALAAAAEQLNAWDRVSGDGDAGETLRSGAAAIQGALAAGTYALDTPPDALLQIAATVRRAAGGTSGGLYDVGITAAAGAMARVPGASVDAWAAALAAGCAAVSAYGGAGVGDRTMLDALLPASSALQDAAAQGAGGRAAAAAAAAAARKGAESTRGMAPRAGRASYVPQASLGDAPDPGAEAVAVWTLAVADALLTGISVPKSPTMQM